MKKKGIAFEVEQFPDFLNAKHLLSLRTLFLEYETAMLSCYYYRCDTRWSVKWRTRLYSIFVFPTHGNLQATTLKGRSIIKPGEFLMLPENVPHSLDGEMYYLPDGWWSEWRMGISFLPRPD